MASLTLGADLLLRPCFFFGLLQLVYLHCSIWLPTANAGLPPKLRLQTSYPPPPILYLLPLLPHHRLLLLAVFLHSLLPLPPDSLRALQWNAGDLRAGSIEVLHFLLSHPVDLICIQESNLNLSSSFQISEFSALQSDLTHYRSGIFSPDATHASGGVIIFVRQGLPFSELSTSSLDPYFDYVRINISLNNSSPLSFLNVYPPPNRSSLTDSRSDSFSPSILPSSINLFILGDFNCHHPFWDSKGTSNYGGEKVFDWIISSDFLPLNDPDIPTLLYTYTSQEPAAVIEKILLQIRNQRTKTSQKH